MDEDDINDLCREIAVETMTEQNELYANEVEDDWLRNMELANPRFFGPDIDETL